VAIVAISPLFSPVFFSSYNIGTLARQISFDIMPALGQLLVILIGGIDLSIGAVMRAAQLVSILTIGYGSITLTFIATIGFGALIGLINGIVAVKGRLEPFIVTLGMWSILDGFSLLFTGGKGIAAKIPPGLSQVGRGYFYGVPYPTIVTIVVIVFAALALHRSIYGRQIYSVGTNDLASYYSGAKVSYIKISVFVVSSVLAALTGFLLAARTGAFQPTTISAGGAGTELATIAAVVVGGARLSGGRGTVLGTVMGAMLTGLLFNLLVLAGIDPYIQALTLGFIILAALLLSAVRRA
jgi:ribose transport system permease protein